MATQNLTIAGNHEERQLQAAKEHIKAKNYRQAKMILNELDHPTAHRWLEKIEEIEMFNENQAPAAKAGRASDTDHQRLAEVTSVFLANDWTVSTQVGSTIIVEKKKTISSLGAAAVLVFFGLIGMFIVLIAIANAKVERITLTESDDGTIRLNGSKSLNTVIRTPQDALKTAQSIKKGATYAATLALGIGATVIWALLLN